MDKEKPIIALDFKSVEETRTFLKLFSKESLNVKVGMELFYAAGPDFVREIVEMGHEIFLDLKLYDIPNTVKSAMTQLAGLGVAMVNVHASGGVEMMEAAKEGLLEGTQAGQKSPILIAVTQLTSRENEINQYEQQLAVTQDESILHLAELTEKSGLDGVVCSPLEVSQIKEKVGSFFLTVTPGIRNTGESIVKDDQVRITTPKQAAEWGSDYIVVGRPITKAKDPLKAYKLIAKEWKMHDRGEYRCQ